MNDFAFGQPVTFTWTLHRRSTHEERGSKGRVWVKRWATEHWPGEPEPEPRPGIVIGKRSLANGMNDYLGYEEGIAFYPEERVAAYLVAFDMHRKPVLVLPEHIAATGACSTCGGTGLVDWEPDAIRYRDGAQQPCPDCTDRGERP